jgi:hypothetical protein
MEACDTRRYAGPEGEGEPADVGQGGSYGYAVPLGGVAGSRYGLGPTDPSRIDLVRLGLADDALV